jgi:hypothetical protein
MRPTQGPVESSKGFSRGNSDLTGPASGPTIASYTQLVNTDRTLLMSASSHSVISVWLVFFSEKHFYDFATFSTPAQMC